MIWTELSFTLGRWGSPLLTLAQQRRVATTLARWAKQNRCLVRLELYGDALEDHEVLAAALDLAGGGSLMPLVRLEPRSDRFRALADAGVREVVFEIPASEAYAEHRFPARGVAQGIEFCRRQAEAAVMQNLRPEIALTDIARASKYDVAELVNTTLKAMQPRSGRVCWRLVDSTGLADPLPGSRLPCSLPAWVRWLGREFGIEPEDISIQASDRLGLATANALTVVRQGASVASSLFGLGHGAGWTPTELLLLHTLEPCPTLKQLIALRDTLVTDTTQRDQHRPLQHRQAWELPADTSPDDMDLKETLLPFHPQTVTGHPIEPLLTALSGKAGLLHLIHRQFPGVHIDTNDSDIEELYEHINGQFQAGRAIPVCWAEIKGVVEKRGIVERYQKEQP